MQLVGVFIAQQLQQARAGGGIHMQGVQQGGHKAHVADFQHGGNFQAGQAFQRKAHNLGLFGSANRTDALQAHLADFREGVAFPAGAADLLCIIILFAFPGGGLGVLGNRKRYVRLDGAQLAVQVGKSNDLRIRKKALILLIERIFLKMGAAKFAIACTLV